MSTNEPPLGPDPERPDGPVPPPPPQPPPSDGPAYPPPPGDAPGYGGSAYPPPPGGGGYGGYPPPPGSGYPPPPGGGSGYPTPFSPTDAISYGWQRFSANVVPWIVLGLLSLVVFAAAIVVITFSSIGFAATDRDAGFGSLLFFFLIGVVVSIVLSVLNAVGTRGALDATEGRQFDLGGAFGRIDIPKVVVLSVILGVIGNLGNLLPGLLGALLSLVSFVFTFLTYFAMTFLVDRGISPVDALVASFELVRDNLGESILLALLAFVVILVGACACGVGLFVAYPVVAIASAYAYKRFQSLPVA